MEKTNIEKTNHFLNRGVFCGDIVDQPTLDHTITDSKGNVVKEVYLVNVKVVFENSKKTVRDESELPVLLSEKQISEIGELEKGDIVFIKGEWRAYVRHQENGSKSTVTRLIARKIEKVEDYTRTRNKIEFEGYLAKKLFKAEFDEEGKLKRDENRRLIPVLDEEGKTIPWVRRNTEGFTVNDIVLRLNKEIKGENGEVKYTYEDYIPAIGYGPVAWQVANEIEIGTPVSARGYLRRRPKNGYEGEYVYEAVITRIKPIVDESKESEKEVKVVPEVIVEPGKIEDQE